MNFADWSRWWVEDRKLCMESHAWFTVWLQWTNPPLNSLIAMPTVVHWYKRLTYWHARKRFFSHLNEFAFSAPKMWSIFNLTGNYFAPNSEDIDRWLGLFHLKHLIFLSWKCPCSNLSLICAGFPSHVHSRMWITVIRDLINLVSFKAAR